MGGYSMSIRRKLPETTTILLLIDRQLLGSPVEAKTLDHTVLIEEDDQAIHFLLLATVLKYGNVGEIGFFNGEYRRVLLVIGIDKDVPIVLLLNSNRRSKSLENFTLGGGTDRDLFVGIVSDLGSLVDPPDGTTTYQDH
jgi:hypothetical protein